MAVASKYAPIFISLSTLFNFTEGYLHTHTLPETIDSFSVADACNDPESSILHIHICLYDPVAWSIRCAVHNYYKTKQDSYRLS
ncbi:hypothetical protein QR46_3397 [Giardia duodenalis assemblage B]|uniref:Uncharacterized protein n=1 Tax=Giardia duodenalis assemblage B TaxID=1394984 RepID=A0A132NRA9_GIAIN|nr:hypothetical protein QR46_3397 [Giardia intestinalis assemblage B]